jgi:hypothetical protein
MGLKDAKLTTTELRNARKLVDKALAPRAIPVYSPEERKTLAILAADLSRRQHANGKNGRAAASAKTRQREARVSLLFWYVIDKKFRRNPTSAATRMEILRWLGETGIKANDTKVARDLRAALSKS